MKKLEIQITAKSAEEFGEVEKAIKSLPDSVSSQIISAENGLAGIKYSIKHPIHNKGRENIYLPYGVSSIKECGKCIYFFYKDVIFVIEREIQCNLSYIFTEI